MKNFWLQPFLKYMQLDLIRIHLFEFIWSNMIKLSLYVCLSSLLTPELYFLEFEWYIPNVHKYFLILI